MRPLALFFALLIALPLFAHAQTKPYKQLGGSEKIAHMVREEREGDYVVLYDLTEQDTVLAWIEHVTPGDRPDYDSADLADVVIWCYPDLYPHENHALPDAKGKISIRAREHVFFVTNQVTPR